MFQRLRIPALSILSLGAAGAFGSALLNIMPAQTTASLGIRLLEPLLRRFELQPIEPIEGYTGIIIPGGSNERCMRPAGSRAPIRI